MENAVCPVLLIGPERICRQIAYVLDYQDYEILPKLKDVTPYRDHKIVVCEFKAKSKKLIKVKDESLDIIYLDDICAMLDREYGKGKPQPIDYNFKRINQLPITDLMPSEMLVKVLWSKPAGKQYNCQYMLHHVYVDKRGNIFCCQHCSIPFGNCLDHDIDHVYNGAYAKIIKLSALNQSYCFCNINRNNVHQDCIKPISVSNCYLNYPQMISLGIDNACNLACPSCRNHDYHMNQVEQQTTQKIINILLKSGWLDKAEKLTMSCMGEVFYSPYYRQLLLTDLRRKQIHIFTNGTLFNEDNWNLIKDKYETISVSVSIDAATPETYAKLRRGGNWQQLMNNLTMLGNLRREQKIKELQIKFVVQKTNYREMPAFVKLGQSINADVVRFTHLNNWGTYTDEEYLGKCLIIDHHYLDYELFKVLQDPIFQLSIVKLNGLQPYLKNSEDIYKKRWQQDLMLSKTIKTILVGKERICRQIAYVLDKTDYLIVPKLKDPEMCQGREIIVCAFKYKSKHLIKIKNKNLEIVYLDDICAMLDREYGKGKPQPVDYNFKRINQLPVTDLMPSEMLVKVLWSKLIKFNCYFLEKYSFISTNGDVKACCSIKIPFGNLNDADLETLYNTAYARIIKLSSLNGSFCLCDIKKCNLVNQKNYQEIDKKFNTDLCPKSVEIAIDRSCNLYCESCRNCRKSVVDATEKSRIEMYREKILASGWLEKADKIIMSGAGEVFYSPTMRDILINGTAKRNNVEILTNGTLFNEDNWNLIKDKYETISVSVSIDAATPETYAKLRRGGNWQQLMKNLQMISQLRQSNKIAKFQINFVVQKSNFCEMKDFIKLGQRLGVDVVKFVKLDNWGTYTDEEYLEKCLIKGNKRLDANLNEVLKDKIFKLPIVKIYIPAVSKKRKNLIKRAWSAIISGRIFTKKFYKHRWQDIKRIFRIK